MFNDPLSVGLELEPRRGEVGRESHVDKKSVREIVIEAVEELVIVNGQHAIIEPMEQRVLKIGLGIPGGFHWFASCNPTAEGRMRDTFHPWSEDFVEVRTHFGAVNGAVHREHSVLEWE